jgi:tRNA threonylcarbamoyl adenosine modification protein YeaZ
MKVLGIDSSGLVASVAVVEDDILLAEYTVNYKKTHSQTLLPMLKEIGDMINLDLNSLDAIAIAAGPGSFTGLRIGSATAKGLGLALDKPIIPVPTVDWPMIYGEQIKSSARSWMQEETRSIPAFTNSAMENSRYWKIRWRFLSQRLQKNLMHLEEKLFFLATAFRFTAKRWRK